MRIKCSSAWISTTDFSRFYASNLATCHTATGIVFSSLFLPLTAHDFLNELEDSVDSSPFSDSDHLIMIIWWKPLEQFAVPSQSLFRISWLDTILPVRSMRDGRTSCPSWSSCGMTPPSAIGSVRASSDFMVYPCDVAYEIASLRIEVNLSVLFAYKQNNAPLTACRTISEVTNSILRSLDLRDYPLCSNCRHGRLRKFLGWDCMRWECAVFKWPLHLYIHVCLLHWL